MLGAIRDAEWLTAGRARAWCRCLAVVSVVCVLAWVAMAHGVYDSRGRPLGMDFSNFWVAAHLAHEGHAAAVYDARSYEAVHRSFFPDTTLPYLYLPYPPPFLLLAAPFATLPYRVALLVWLALGFGAFFVALRSLVPERSAIMPIVAFPAVLVTCSMGQNGFLTAACLGGGMVLAGRRPFVAGLCLGLLVFKPHLLLAAPIALFAARRWTIVAGVIVSVTSTCGLSFAVFGKDAWLGFLRVSQSYQGMGKGFVGIAFWQMDSAFAAVRVLQGSAGLAFVVQGVVALAALAVLFKVAWRKPGAYAEGAALIAATVLCTPYLLDYDLVCLAFPMAWVLTQAQRSGWLPWEKSALLMAYVMPFFGRPMAFATHLPVGPLVLGSLLVVVVRRAQLSELKQSRDVSSPLTEMTLPRPPSNASRESL